MKVKGVVGVVLMGVWLKQDPTHLLGGVSGRPRPLGVVTQGPAHVEVKGVLGGSCGGVAKLRLHPPGVWSGGCG